MGFWSGLAKLAGRGLKLAPVPGAGVLGDVLEGAGGALNAVSQSAANNRGVRLEAALAQEAANQQRQAQYFDQSMAREADRRASGNDAFRNGQRAAYLEGAADYKPANGLPSYGFGPRAATEAEKVAARQFAAEQQRRLAAGDSLLPQVKDPGRFEFDKKDLNASGWEKFSGIAGAGLSGLTALRKQHPDMSDAQLRTMAEALKRLNITGFGGEIDPNKSERG